MQVAVINGSPKGEYSVTLQTVRYLERVFPEDTFTCLHVGQRIRALEKDMDEALAILAQADLLLFSYPVYTFLAPSQLHRFVELLKQSGVDLSGKAATQLTTSKHFYDVTAHRYIADNCADLGLRVIPGLSADMDDLLTETGRREAKEFWRNTRFCMDNALFETPSAAPTPLRPYTRGVAAVEKTETYDVALVTDLRANDTALAAMLDDLQSACAFPVRVINLADGNVKGGCLGCFRCAVSGKCVYTDGFDAFLREHIQTADAVVYAFTISDHSMGARFKMFDDRQFCNGHRTVTTGMPVGYIVHGDYAAEPNLRTVIEARSNVGGNPLAGVATDAYGIAALAKKLGYLLETRPLPTKNFYGVGGMKIFRDLIYTMRGLMRADHRFYKSHGLYDFPQKQVGRILGVEALGLLLSLPNAMEKMGNRMNEGMVAPYRKVVERAKSEASTVAGD